MTTNGVSLVRRKRDGVRHTIVALLEQSIGDVMEQSELRSWIEHRAEMLFVCIKCLVLMIVGVAVAVSWGQLADNAEVALSIAVAVSDCFCGLVPMERLWILLRYVPTWTMILRQQHLASSSPKPLSLFI